MNHEALDWLRARRDRLAHDIEMMRNDAEHWNLVHPDEKPIDVAALVKDPEGLLANIDRRLVMRLRDALADAPALKGG